LVPLPVDRRAATLERDHDPLSVVSVGRLVDFKYIHGQVIGALQQLREKGISLTYTAYGDGPLRDRLQADIRSFGAEGWVRAPGMLPYEQFSQVVSRAWAFIGCGSALIEAAMLGVPCLVQASVKRPVSYGWFHSVVGHNIGQNDLDEYDLFGAAGRSSEQVALTRSFEELHAMPPDEYARLGEGCRTRANADFAADTVLAQYDRVFR